MVFCPLHSPSCGVVHYIQTSNSLTESQSCKLLFFLLFLSTPITELNSPLPSLKGYSCYHLAYSHSKATNRITFQQDQKEANIWGTRQRGRKICCMCIFLTSSGLNQLLIFMKDNMPKCTHCCHNIPCVLLIRYRIVLMHGGQRVQEDGNLKEN